jgi:hypothetical protein
VDWLCPDLHRRKRQTDSHFSCVRSGPALMMHTGRAFNVCASVALFVCACVCCAAQAVSQGGPDSFAARQAAYCQLTAAELLQDAVGYQRWLGQLVNLLARERDLVSSCGGCRCSILRGATCWWL